MAVHVRFVVDKVTTRHVPLRVLRTSPTNSLPSEASVSHFSSGSSAMGPTCILNIKGPFLDKLEVRGQLHVPAALPPGKVSAVTIA
jgi:hypothetical protein